MAVFRKAFGKVASIRLKPTAVHLRTLYNPFHKRLASQVAIGSSKARPWFIKSFSPPRLPLFLYCKFGSATYDQMVFAQANYYLVHRRLEYRHGDRTSVANSVPARSQRPL